MRHLRCVPDNGDARVEADQHRAGDPCPVHRMDGGNPRTVGGIRKHQVGPGPLRLRHRPDPDCGQNRI